MILRVVYSFSTIKEPHGKPSYEMTEVGAYYIDMGKNKSRPTVQEMEKYAMRDTNGKGYNFTVVAWQEVNEKEVDERMFVWDDEEIIEA